MTLPAQQAASVYPWRDDTHCKLLVDENAYLPEILGALRAAEDYVLLEMYLVESGRVLAAVIDELLAAAERDVRVAIIFDGFGSRQLSKADTARLRHPNIALSFYHPFRWARPFRYLVRDHRKMIVVDGNRGFTGGIGLCDGIQLSHSEVRPWHDTVLEFSGSVVNDWQDLFGRQWQLTKGNAPDLELRRARPSIGCAARLVSSNPTRINAIYGHVRQRAALAARRIWLATPYFLPSWRMRRVLYKAAERGVEIRLLVPGPITDNPAVRYASQRFYLRLLRVGIKIYEYEPTFMHAKAALIDDWSSIGSSNFDRWSISRNLEANLEISDSKFAEELEAMFLQDIESAKQISLNDWIRRPAWQRWRERLWGSIELLVDRH